MTELSIWDFVDPEPSASVLPPESRRTLARFDDERHLVRESCFERERARDPEVKVVAFVRAFDSEWPRYVATWLLEETVIVARALALHVTSPASFYLNRDEPLVLSLN
jgi:hypothetical protein